MDAELTGFARRFAACPKWVWLPGMLVASRHEEEQGFHPHRVVNVRIGGAFAQAAAGFRETYDIGLRECIPDLDDETTRAAVLPVVRRAWDDPHAFVRFFDRTPLEGHWFWECGVGSRRQCGFVADVKHGELLALLAALESAK